MFTRKKLLSLLMIITLSIAIGLLSNIDLIYNSIFYKHSVSSVKDAFFILLIIFLGFLLVYYIAPKRVFKIVLIGYVLRILVLLLIAIYDILPYAFDTQWHEISYYLLDDWKKGILNLDTNTGTNVKYYTLLTTFVYFVFGYNPIYMMLANVIFGTITLVFVYKMALKLFSNNQVAVIGLLIMTFWPTHILFSAMHMRDSLSTLLIVLLMYEFIKWMDNSNLKHLFFCFLLLLLNALIREQNALLNLVSIAPFYLYLSVKKSNKLLVPVIIQLSIISVFTIFVFLSLSGFLDKVSLDYFVREMSWRTKGEALYLEWMTYNSWFDILLYSPIRIFYFMYTPFIWTVTDLTQFLSFLESSFLLLISLFILLNFRRAFISTEKKIQLLFILAFLMIGIAANASIDSNVGTAIRHKLQYLHVLFILFSYVYYVKRNHIVQSNKRK
ncbi:glycosyltransferase family 39 protein [Halalkalibacter urbisdiaboli]|uniref:glycosyltransferase family 39 protein n=1 Tax=Halalkalibacter urbisdiaboli TaxID=1960589 RepID=UPI000B450518|nr:glycosyltransferase family 39 protein [Halalkalibacter urbisdiaboli]